MHMKTTPRSQEDGDKLDTLDALLAHAPRYTPSAGFAERVLAALHEEEQQECPFVAVRPLPRPWYLRPYCWGSAAAAACVALLLSLLPLLEESPTEFPAESLAVDDALLVEEALDAIDDPDLISAICSVSDASARHALAR